MENLCKCKFHHDGPEGPKYVRIIGVPFIPIFVYLGSFYFIIVLKVKVRLNLYNPCYHAI